ncbi:hypothetical protein RUM44_007837 [Polyplax serrata]|uniref:HAP1 N-terminal domain-containing protein n=1 Tax=Polyplax serrata TaxID=468196 RepID=A0ABR1BB12_POLSC
MNCEKVCSGEEIPEVEIISLLEEQIPRYKLRADTLTQFSGYENEDWFIPAPALKPEEQSTPLSPDQIRETLNYFSKYFFWKYVESFLRIIKKTPQAKTISTQPHGVDSRY